MALQQSRVALEERDFLIATHERSEAALAGHASALTTGLESAAANVEALFTRYRLHASSNSDQSWHACPAHTVVLLLKTSQLFSWAAAAILIRILPVRQVQGTMGITVAAAPRPIMRAVCRTCHWKVSQLAAAEVALPELKVNVAAGWMLATAGRQPTALQWRIFAAQQSPAWETCRQRLKLPCPRSSSAPAKSRLHLTPTCSGRLLTWPVCRCKHPRKMYSQASAL